MWKSTEYSATRRHASFAGDMIVSRQAHGFFPVNQGGTADLNDMFVPVTKKKILCNRDFLYKKGEKYVRY